jgi:acyl-coenzyme A thioesterase PaaI-like protein
VTEDRLGHALRRLVDVLCVADLPPGEDERIASAVDALADAAAHHPVLDEPKARYFQSSPLVGYRNPVAPPIERYRDDRGRAVCDVTLGTRYQGNAGWVHGAHVAAVWDEVLAIANPHEGAPSVTASLSVHYRKPTPLDVPLHFVAQVDRVDGRKAWSSGTCTTADGTVRSEAEALFIAVDPKMVPAFTEGLTEAD